MPPRDQSDIWGLSDLRTPWCLHVIATLRIADHIAAGKTKIDDLAAASLTHADSLHRVMTHLVAKGVFEEPAAGLFALNDPARALLELPLRLGLDLDGFGPPITKSSVVPSGRICKRIQTSARASMH